MKFVKVLPLLFTLISPNNLLNAAQETSVTPTFTKPTAKTIPAPKKIQQPKIAPSDDAQASGLRKETSADRTTDKAPKVMPKAVTPAAPVNVPYLKELQEAKMSPAILSGWQQLYEQFLQANGAHPDVIAKSEAANSSSPVIPDSSHVIPGSKRESKSLSTQNPLFSTNFFNLMATYLNPATFPKFANDPDGQIHFNYATTHLRDTVTRLGSISSITNVSGTPAVNWVGDCRDMGIIVNIQNNTDAQFTINQTSLDGTKTMQIGQLNPGLNEVNLHTAALQAPTTAVAVGLTAKPGDLSVEALAKSEAASEVGESKSEYFFEIIELNAEDPIKISLRIMTGTELINFLKTLPRSKHALEKDTFKMNGLPTSPDYLATTHDFYMVLTQNPTSKNASERDPNQRIQAINISKLSGPYLLTMQINAENIEIKTNSKPEQTFKTLIFQPSITQAQILTDSKIKPLNFSFLILPKFLSKLEKLQALWMLATTSALAAHTNYALFGPKTFANAFEYFKNLSCFNNQNRYDFFIDLYNRFRGDYVLYNASWLMANNIYETDLSHCSDMPQIYTAQDPYGHVIVNEHNFYYVNFLAMFTPQVTEPDNEKLFNTQGFNVTYTYPLNQLYSFMVNALASEIKEGIFGAATQIKPGVFQLTWTNKKNKIINSQTLYLHAQPSNIQITFDNIHTNWVGSAVPTNLLPLEIGKTQHFKVTYEFSPANNKHILLAQATSAIDRQEVFLPLQFSEFPIQELYIDLFNTFNVKPFTRCYVIKDGVLPKPLLSLTQEDWQSGVYMVPLIHNNEKLSPTNPGALALAFYGPAKNYLGEMTIPGQFNNTNETGIKEPIHAYNACFNHSKSLMDLYLSTGVLLKYL